MGSTKYLLHYYNNGVNGPSSIWSWIPNVQHLGDNNIIVVQYIFQQQGLGKATKLPVISTRIIIGKDKTQA